MTAVGIVPHPGRPNAHVLAKATAAWLRAHDIEVRVPVNLAGAAGLDDYAVANHEFKDGLDLALSLGGDGTMLHTVQLVYRKNASGSAGADAGWVDYLRLE